MKYLECDFCDAGEEAGEIRAYAKRTHIEYRYKDTGKMIAGNACDDCIEFLNDQPDIEMLVGEQVFHKTEQPTSDVQELSKALDWAGIANIVTEDGVLARITISRDAIELFIATLVAGSKYA